MIEDIVVCADDYGLFPSIDDAILDLAERARISAVSCMTTSPQWPAAAKRLAPFADRLDIGLHITLVDEVPLTAMPGTARRGRLPSLPALMAASFARRLDLDEIGREIEAQCQAFVAAVGRAPAHLDGHRHAHVLTGIREQVLACAAKLSPRPWLRDVGEPVARILARGVAVPKTLVIAALGRRFAAQARASGLALNDGFSGAYAFAPDADLPALYDRFLSDRGERALIMCHPGAAPDSHDAIGPARVREFAFLKSAEFPAALARHGCRVARFTAPAP